MGSSALWEHTASISSRDPEAQVHLAAPRGSAQSLLPGRPQRAYPAKAQAVLTARRWTGAVELLRPVSWIPSCDLLASNSSALQPHCISASQRCLQSVLWPVGELFLGIQLTWTPAGFQLIRSQLSSRTVPRRRQWSAPLTSLRVFVTWGSVSSGSVSDAPCTQQIHWAFYKVSFSEERHFTGGLQEQSADLGTERMEKSFGVLVWFGVFLWVVFFCLVGFGLGFFFFCKGMKTVFLYAYQGVWSLKKSKILLWDS